MQDARVIDEDIDGEISIRQRRHRRFDTALGRDVEIQALHVQSRTEALRNRRVGGRTPTRRRLHRVPDARAA